MYLTEKYVNPFTDFGFKKLFGTEPNKEFLISFLNTLLPEEHQIESLTYSTQEKLGFGIVDRRAIFDLFCIAKNGTTFIVEVQKAKQDFFKDRSVFYATFPIQDQAKKGIWNFELTHVYTIGILDFIFDETKENTDVLTTVKLKNHKNQIFYDKLTFIYLEMPKFNKSEEELTSNFDKWMYVFKHLPDLEKLPKVLQEKLFKRFFEQAKIANFNREERKDYEESLKVYRDLINVVSSSKREGIEEGKIEGRRLGIEVGRKEGKEEGKTEERKKIIQNLLKQDFSIEQISKILHLTEQEINELL